MKKHLCFILTMGLMVMTLSACGKNNPDEDIKIIEASDAAESKEPTERKYADTKEPDEAPDRENGVNSNLDVTTNSEENTIINRDPTIYGIWSSNDNTNLTIFNSLDGIKFIMYDAPNDRYITGDITTDDSTYIEMKYLKPVEQEIPVESESIEEGEQSIEDDSINPYGSDEELYAALEAEHEAQYETVKYSIDKNEFNQETATMLLVLSNPEKTLELYMTITADTPDYSTDDNEFAKDMVIEDGGEEIIEEVTE